MNLGQGAATIVGLIVIIALVITDIVLARSGKRNTPSDVVRWVSRFTAVVPFGLGVLMGHWFHPGDDAEPLLGSNSTLVLIGIGAVIGIGGLVLGFRHLRIAAWPWAVLGAILGALLWPV